MDINKELKVLIRGLEVIKESPFTLVAIGTYQINEEGLLGAIRKAISDKYNEKNPPQFNVVYFNIVKVKNSDTKITTTVVFVCQKVVPDDRKNDQAYIAGKATFIQFKEEFNPLL